MQLHFLGLKIILMPDIYLTDIARDVLVNILPVGIISVTSSPCIPTIRTLREFSQWCSRKGDVDMVIRDILQCDNLDISIRIKVATSLLHSHRISEEHEKQLKSIKRTLLSSRRKITREVADGSIQLKRKMDITNSDRCKRIRLFSSETVIDSNIVSIDLNVMIHILSYAGPLCAWTLKLTNKAFYNAYRNVPVSLYIPFDNINMLFIHSFRCIAQINESNLYKDMYDISYLIHNIQKLKLKKSLTYNIHKYNSDICTILERFYEVFREKKYISWWPIGLNGIKPSPLIASLGKTSDVITYYIDTIQFDNVMLVTNTMLIDEYQKRDKKHENDSLEEYRIILENRAQFIQHIEEIYNHDVVHIVIHSRAYSRYKDFFLGKILAKARTLNILTGKSNKILPGDICNRIHLSTKKWILNNFPSVKVVTVTVGPGEGSVIDTRNI